MRGSTGFGPRADPVNIFYDGLLHLHLPEGVSVVEFADNVVLVTVNHNTEGLKRATNEGFLAVEKWVRDHGIELAHHKTEAVVLPRKWAYRQPELFRMEFGSRLCVR